MGAIVQNKVARFYGPPYIYEGRSKR